MADKLNRMRIQLCSIAYTLSDEGRLEAWEVDRITRVIERMGEEDIVRMLRDVAKLAEVA